MKISIYFFLLFCIACSPITDKNRAPKVVIVNHKLKESVNNFVAELVNNGEKDKSITIFIEKTGDTTFIAIVNSLPDIKMAKINGMLNLNGYSIYLTGTLLENLYKVQSEKFYKIDDILLNKRVTKISDIKFSEPLQWDIAFVGDSLIPSRSAKRAWPR